MTSLRGIVRWVCIAAVVLSCSMRSAQAQQRRPAQNKTAESAVVVSSGDDPAVLAVFESHPKTAAELLRAIDTLAHLRRSEMATGFVQQLLDLKLSAADLVKLGDGDGMSILISMAADTTLAPELQKL